MTSLNGEPEVGVTVRAMCIAQEGECMALGEEGLTENDGAFRIKGLRPGCEYELTVRDKEEQFSRVIPEKVSLTVSNEDFTNVRFIAFRPLTGFEVSGYVITPMEFLPSIKVSLIGSRSLGFRLFLSDLEWKLHFIEC